MQIHNKKKIYLLLVFCYNLSNITELDIERGRLVQRLRRDLDEQKNLVTEAITTFENVSHTLYEEAGSLTLNPTENGLKAEVRIQGQLSQFEDIQGR